MSERISRQKILDFIGEANGKIGKREIAKAFHIKGSEKIILKQILKEMLNNGEIIGHGREGLRLPDGLPSVGVIEVTHKNDDGDIFGKIILNGVLREQPDILITSRLRPPGIGDRVLARLKKVNDAQYNASVMKKSPRLQRSALSLWSLKRARITASPQLTAASVMTLLCKPVTRLQMRGIWSGLRN